MMDANDFGNRIIRRLDKKLSAIELDDYSAEQEVKLLNGILDGLLRLEKLTRDNKNDDAGREIARYSDAFRRSGGDGVHRGDAEGRSDTFHSDSYNIESHSFRGTDDPAA